MKTAALLPLCVAATALSAPVDFNREVKPIFETHCGSCHGPEKQKSEYRLDSRSAALAGGESGKPAIVPGHPEDGSLLRLVSGLDKELFMPPRKSDAKPLSDAQIQTLRQWIAEGASWPTAPGGVEAAANREKKYTPRKEDLAHWSFQPLKQPTVPPGKKHPIDAFIGAKLQAHGLTPASEADRRTLIRRLYYNLTGLPPSFEEVQAFCADTAPAAYERLVDRLLESPRYGEHWARHWLDVVHFGETHGYDKDKLRPNAWPYRDYVIGAFNSDKPYTRFVQEQIAGDVLFPETVEGITALGFIAAGPWDFIGHAEVPETKIDGKIARHLDRDDMVSNTINTFQSVTIHCAQCHDHKFDPLPQRDYYALQAVFAALDRTELDYFPDDSAMRQYGDLQRQKKRILEQISAIEEPLKKKAGEAYAALSKRIDATPTGTKQPNLKPESGYHGGISPMQETVKWVQVDLGGTQKVQRVVLKPCYDDFRGIGAGFGFPVRFKIEVSDDPYFRSGVALLSGKHESTCLNDFPNPGLKPFETDSEGASIPEGRYVRVTATKLASRKGDFIFALAEMEVFSSPEGSNLAAGAAVTALDSIESPARWRRANLTDGIAPNISAAEDKQKLIQERDALLFSNADEPTAEKLRALRKQRDTLPGTPGVQKVYAGGIHTGSGNFKGTGAKDGAPRPIHLLRRGDVKQPLDEVEPGILSVLGQQFAIPFDLGDATGESARRAALARWITHPSNALTWRSIVNRVWHYHFGRGIVETPNDFGRMGAAPTHPELLEWLAVWFRDEARGSLKALHKLIVMSDTYRQTSTPDEAATARASAMDGSNTLLWRQNRRRLEAEATRDSLLLAAGKLNLSMGGPSFQDFVIEKPEHSPHYQYHLANADDPKIHRRSIYRFLVRSQQHPWMSTLDCADPSMLVDRRNQTITPLQALAQLNNQLCVVMSEHFATRIGDRGVEELFRIALQRNPTALERAEFTAYVQKHGLPNACRIVLNMNEFIFVD